jgi:hypothetical protein
MRLVQVGKDIFKAVIEPYNGLILFEVLILLRFYFFSSFLDHLFDVFDQICVLLLPHQWLYSATHPLKVPWKDTFDPKVTNLDLYFLRGLDFTS